MFKEIKSTGTPHAYYYRRDSAASRLRANMFTGLRSRYLFVTGITPALSSENREMTLQIVEELRTAGTTIVFDRTCDTSCGRPRPLARYFWNWPRDPMCFSPADEAKLMTGLDKLDQIAEALLQLGPTYVAIKAGDQGAYFADATLGLVISTFSRPGNRSDRSG